MDHFKKDSFMAAFWASLTNFRMLFYVHSVLKRQKVEGK